MILNPMRAAVLVLIMPVMLIAPTPDSLAAEIKPGEGLVIFSREDKFKGKAIRFNISVDGRPGLQLPAGSTIELSLPVGTHMFAVSSPSLDGQDFMSIDVKEGWTYRVEGHVLLGWPTGRPKFKRVAESGPRLASSSLPPPGASTSRPEVSVLAGPELGAVTAQATAGTQARRSGEERGRIGLRNFVGNWSLDTWALADDGTRLAGHGLALGSAESDSAVRIYITEFEAAAFPAATGGGQVRIAYAAEKGFTLESRLANSAGVLKFSGSYDAETGRYVFYLEGDQGATAAGSLRRPTRVEIRSIDLGTWTAETYASIDDQSVQVQSFRFYLR
jgi:hypothetical protein